MGRASTDIENHALQPVAKNFAALALTPVFFMLVACQSTPVQKKNSNKNPPQENALGLRLTKTGENWSGRFSPDGSKILFVSKRGSANRGAQIYEFNLESFEERRVTFQDGDCRDPLYTPDGKKIIYASSTDELKEHPKFFFPQYYEGSYQPTEIYASDPYGVEIQRLTTRQGFQGLMSWVPGPKKVLILSSGALATWELELLDVSSLHSQTIFFSEKNLLLSPLRSETGLLLWIERDPKSEESMIYYKAPREKAQPLPLPPGQYEDLSWWDQKDEKILFSSNLLTQKISEIFFYDLKNQCFGKVIGTTDIPLRDPQLSPDQKKLLFTATEEGIRQVYLRDFHPEQLVCEKTVPSTSP